MPGGVGGGDGRGPSVVIGIVASTADLGTAERNVGRDPERGGAERKGIGESGLETSEQGRRLGDRCRVFVAGSCGDSQLGEGASADCVQLAGVLEALAFRLNSERCANDLRGLLRMAAPE